MFNNGISEEFEDVAIIGMSGRFPGADDIDTLWRNLCDGRESIHFFSDDELHPAHIQLNKKNSNYVKARGVIDHVENFDADFFGILPREAQLMDPQNRIFLEVSWNALENAGYEPESYDGKIGLFAGKGYNSYFANNVSTHKKMIETYGEFEVWLLNEKDFFTTQVSYKLNLNGPSLNINTGCSTSLVAICQAYDSLLSCQCDIALAGGITIYSPQNSGYVYQAGKIVSSDGHTRPFDYQSTGTVFSNGAGVVALKRLSDALRDFDNIYAVIKGCGLNNDGSDKLSFTAPSVNGQVDAILQAQVNAGINPDSISFIEAHGTATNLGDPIEVEALTRAFRKSTEKKQFCAVGSVKSNVGHLDSAAGVAGFIKAALALHHKKIPPSINYNISNPNINFSDSPFYVCKELTELKSEDIPLRAGVSSFGVGGTNAHIILEEAPNVKILEYSRPWQLILLSAKTDTALIKRKQQFAEYLKGHDGIKLSDAAYTLQTGRQNMSKRSILVCRDINDVVKANEGKPEDRFLTKTTDKSKTSIIFMFPGQGSQHINMGRELYVFEPTFKSYIDTCAKILEPLLNLDIRNIIYPNGNMENKEKDFLKQTGITQPALFTVEYALAQLWKEWGIRPGAMIGHSIGEYTAACLAGVFSLEDALAVVAERARLMQELPGGSMRAVRLSLEEIRPFLDEGISIAACNTPSLSVLSGTDNAMDLFEKKLNKQHIESIRLHTSHAFHSVMMEPAIKPFLHKMKSVTLNPPKIPYISNVSGTWITREEATDPAYWANQLLKPVLFSDGIIELQKLKSPVLIEVGPSTALTSAANQHRSEKQTVISSLGHAGKQQFALKLMLKALGEVWLAGKRIDWASFYRWETRRKIPLPAYPFDGKRYWIEPVEMRNVNAETGEEPYDDEGSLSVPDQKKYTPNDSCADEKEYSKHDRIVLFLKTFFSELSGIKMEDFNDSATFLEMGFDSLFLIQISAKLESVFNAEIDFLKLIQNYSTFELLSEYLENELAVDELNEDEFRDLDVSTETDHKEIKSSAESLKKEYKPEIMPFPRYRNLPLSSMQKRLWYLDRLNPESSVYNLPFYYRFSGKIDVSLLKKCFQEIIRRHEPLRTTFTLEQDVPVQVISESLEIEIPLVNLSHITSPEREKELEQHMALEAVHPFKLSEGPLIRASLIKMSEVDHVLFFMPHHIVFDGVSFQIFQHELFELYKAYIEDRSCTEPEVPVQYADYAVWQQEWMHSEAFNKDLLYWKENLKGDLPVLQLPTDYSRPAVLAYNGARITSTLPKIMVRHLNELGKNQDATLFMVLLSAFNVLLARYSNQKDICVGSPMANRKYSEVSRVIGFFTNTLVFRTNLDGNPTFNELLKRVKDICLNAFRYQDMPFDQLVQELKPERNLSMTPLYQAMFIFKADMYQDMSMSDISFQSGDVAINATQTDLSLFVGRTDDGLDITLEYCTDLFHADTIKRMVDNFKVLLKGIIENPKVKTSELPLISEHEKHLIEGWNNTGSDYPRNKSITELFESQTEETPNAIALTFNDISLTFAELNAKANQVAHYLKSLGVVPETMVALCIERSFGMITSILGILKAGGAYVPLDPEYPPERMKIILTDTESKIIITQTKFKQKFSDLNLITLCLETEETIFSAQENHNPESGATPETLAYVMYTSGSTGQPKGIEITHRNVVRLVKNTNYINLNKDEVFLQYAPISFDASTLEIWGPLLNGGKMVICPPGQISPVELGRIIKENNVSTLWLTAALFHNVVEYNIDSIKSVKQLLAGGDILSPASVKKVLTEIKDICLINGYGPTENTTFTCCNPMTDVSQVGSTVSIGRPVSNTNVYILDACLNTVPVGVIGELYTSGDGVARGYLNKPGLTETVFIEDAFLKNSDSRLYKTGDLARYLPDGNIEFWGRIDGQVKLRGYRIELGEIEHVLTRHNAVNQVVAIIREDQPGDKRLVVYYIPNNNLKTDAKELRMYLLKKLPKYMEPQHFIKLESFPVTPNGKIDRRALPAPSDVSVGIGQSFIPPGTEIEKGIAKIWQDVIGCDKIGIKDNFFEIGGHSILAVSVFSKISQMYKLDLPLTTLFQVPTVEMLADNIEKMLKKDAKSKQENGVFEKPEIIMEDKIKNYEWLHLVPIKPGGSKIPFFCMHAVGGNVLNYYAFVSEISPDQPLYGLQALGLDGLSDPYKDIPTMAKNYLKEIKSVQPKGPYMLGGGSMGGLIAYEIAQQLQSEGEKTVLLALFDTFAPHKSSILKYQSNSIFSKAKCLRLMKNNYLYLKENRIKKILLYVISKIKFRFIYRSKMMICKIYKLCNMAIPHNLRHWYVERKNMKPAFTYLPSKYDGDIVLFSDSTMSTNSDDLKKGWEVYIRGNIKVIKIPAKHNEFIEAPLVAIELNKQLRDVQNYSYKRGCDSNCVTVSNSIQN